MKWFSLITILVFLDLSFNDIQAHQSSGKPKVDTAYINDLNNYVAQNYETNAINCLEINYKARLLSQKINYSIGLIQTYRNQGLICWAFDDYPEALSNFFKANEMLSAFRESLIEANVLGNIALVYNSIGNYQEAERYILMALKIHKKLENNTRKSILYNSLGDSYLGLHKFGKAIECYNKAIDLLKTSPNRFGMGVNYRNIGNVYEALGDVDHALDYYFLSLDIFFKEKIPHRISSCYLSIASAYKKKNKLSLAQEYALKCLEGAIVVKKNSTVRDVCQILSEIAERQNRPLQSLKYYKLYRAYSDSVLTLNKAFQISSIRLKFETKEKEKQIFALRKNITTKQNLINRRNNLLLLQGFLLIFIVLTLMVIYINLVRLRKAHGLLNSKTEEIKNQNKEIQRQKDELSTLNEEVLSQQDQLTYQRDLLVNKNEEILKLNKNLEGIIEERTLSLKQQQKQLIEYSFINAHKIRGPLARILGLVYLLKQARNKKDRGDLLEYLQHSSNELDEIIKTMKDVLQGGIDIFSDENKIES